MNLIDSTPEFVAQAYKKIERRLEVARRRMGRPLTLAEKVLLGHLADPGAADLRPGESYLQLLPDRRLAQRLGVELGVGGDHERVQRLDGVARDELEHLAERRAERLLELLRVTRVADVDDQRPARVQPVARELEELLRGQVEGDVGLAVGVDEDRVVALVRGPQEPADDAVRAFYERLLAVLADTTVRDGEWRHLEPVAAWDGNWTSDCCLAALWTGKTGERRLVAVNYADNQSQCYVRLPEIDSRLVRFRDVMGSSAFDRNGDDLRTRGLYLDVPPWGYHVFEMTV